MKIYPLDATFDDKESVPESVATSKRYKQFSGYSIQEVVDRIKIDFGSVDYVVHSLGRYNCDGGSHHLNSQLYLQQMDPR